jgi:hypothetical protein
MEKIQDPDFPGSGFLDLACKLNCRIQHSSLQDSAFQFAGSCKLSLYTETTNRDYSRERRRTRAPGRFPPGFLEAGTGKAKLIRLQENQDKLLSLTTKTPVMARKAARRAEFFALAKLAKIQKPEGERSPPFDLSPLKSHQTRQDDP